MGKAIHFSFADRKPSLTPVGHYRDWVHAILLQYGLSANSIHFVFCSDNYLLQINKQYLQHDYFTDIITFDLSEPDDGAVSAEIYISWDRVKENAYSNGATPYQELRRVMAHGILHLAGFGDKTKREKDSMTHQENRCLRLWEHG